MEVINIMDNRKIYIFNQLSDIAKSLIKEFCDTLQISYNDACSLILKNTTSLAFLNCEGQLIVLGKRKSLELLMKSTIFRTEDFDKPITDEEINRVLKFYSISISKENKNPPPEVLT